MILAEEILHKWLQYAAWAVLFFFLSILGLYFFIELGEDIFSSEIIYFDRLVINFVVSFRSVLLTKMMLFLTALGNLPFVVISLFVFAGWFAFKREGYFAGLLLILGVFSAAGCNLLLKMLFQRVRPEEFRLIMASGYSFPSGHAMVSTVYYWLLAYLFYQRLQHTVGKRILAIILATIPFLIGISRIYLGVHYPSDVLAGFAAGGCLVFGLFCIAKIYEIKRLEAR